ncbi:alpha/beta fold hydrolase [Streptomyces sp. NPDC088156]
MEEVAADGLAVADGRGWDAFSVIGHSMGGKAARLMSLDAPSRVRSIVAISPVPASGFPLEGEMRELLVGAAEDPGNRRTIFGDSGRRLPRWPPASAFPWRPDPERKHENAFRAGMVRLVQGFCHHSGKAPRDPRLRPPLSRPAPSRARPLRPAQRDGSQKRGVRGGVASPDPASLRSVGGKPCWRCASCRRRGPAGRRR